MVGPTKRNPRRLSSFAIAADSVFWRTLRDGAYDQIPRAMALLKAAYLQNPRDPETAAHVGFLHAWRLAERARLAAVPPTLTDDAVLARTYFERAAAHGPASPEVIDGFLAAFQRTEGEIHADPALSAAGLARGRAAARRWPAFNAFTLGYTLSGRPDSSALFREGIELQWASMAACRAAAVDRADPAVGAGRVAQMAQHDERTRRACGNSWIAPHNAEGFFLNMGDMLVKAGDWRTARRVYGLARLEPTYPRWAYRAVLEAREADAERNVTAFRAPEVRGRPPAGSASADPARRIMLRTPFACMACHQGDAR